MINSTLVLAALFLLPGVVGLIKSRGSIAASSTISLGFVSVFAYFGLFAVVNRYTDIPFTVLTASLGYVALLVAMWFWVPKGLPQPRQPLSHALITVFGLAAVSAFHLLIWNHAFKFGAVLPNHDVYIHTNWVGNMARLKSLSSVAAYTHPISGAGSAAPLYPFSMHALGAYVVQLGAGHATVVVIALTRLSVVLFWPLGIFSLARSIGLRARTGAVAAAATTVALYNFPYSTLGWGGVSMVIGIIILVHCVAVAIDYVPQGLTRLLLICGVLCFALLMAHTSEAFIFPIMLLVLGIPTIRRTSDSKKIYIFLTVISLLMFVYPWIDKWWGNGYISNLAATGLGAGTGTVYQGIGLIVTLSAGMEFSSLWVPGILAAGLLAVSYLNKYRNILYFYGLTFLGAFITSQVDHKPWTEISMAFSPWYRQFQRMVYLVVPAVALLGGLAIEALVTYRSQRTVRRTENVARISLAFLTIISMLTFSWSRTARVFEILVGSYSTLSTRDLSAPEKIPGFVGLQSNILSSFDSGIGYWAADYGVKIFGAPQLPEGLALQREALLDSIATFAISKDSRNLVQDLNVTHVVTNSRFMSGGARPDPTAIQHSGNFDLLWTGDTVKVWKIRSVVSGIAGKLSVPFESSKDKQSNWILENSVRLGIHNLTQASKSVEISFFVSQNSCKNAKSFQLGDNQPVLFSNGNSHFVKVLLELNPLDDVKQELKINSDPCVIPETGETQFVAIGPITTIIK